MGVFRSMNWEKDRTPARMPVARRKTGPNLPIRLSGGGTWKATNVERNCLYFPSHRPTLVTSLL